MSEGRCQNPNCGSIYTIKKDDVDDGYCCFSCWEEANCHDPEAVPVEEFAKNC